jgi:chromosomal replication initiator protein
MNGDLILSRREQRMATIARVAARHGVTVREVLGSARSGLIVEARHAAMVEVRLEFGDSAAAIGRLFNRDHTTVLYALRKAA